MGGMSEGQGAAGRASASQIQDPWKPKSHGGDGLQHTGKGM